MTDKLPDPRQRAVDFLSTLGRGQPEGVRNRNVGRANALALLYIGDVLHRIADELVKGGDALSTPDSNPAES